jgi:hypothetical protein
LHFHFCDDRNYRNYPGIVNSIVLLGLSGEADATILVTAVMRMVAEWDGGAEYRDFSAVGIARDGMSG